MSRTVARALAVVSGLFLVLGAVLPSWWESVDQEERSFSLLTALGMFEDAEYASDANRLAGALLPVGFIGLLICTALAVVAAASGVAGRRSRRFLRFAQVVAGLLLVGAVVPGAMSLIALGKDAARLGMLLYLPGVIGYTALCFSSLNAAWADANRRNGQPM